MKFLTAGIAALCLTGAAAAEAVSVDVASEAGSVTVVRGAEVLDASAVTSLVEGDRVLSTEAASYTMTLENCSRTVEGANEVVVAGAACQDDNLFFTDGQINPLWIGAGVVAGVIIISEVADDDDDDAPATP